MYRNCNELLKVAEDCLDEFSKHEIHAYVESMKAAYLIEAKKWEEALDSLLNSKIIL